MLGLGFAKKCSIADSVYEAVVVERETLRRTILGKANDGQIGVVEICDRLLCFSVHTFHEHLCVK